MGDIQPDSAETRKLLEQVGQGDQEAFGRLFDRHRLYLRETIELRMDARLRGRVDPSDIVQDTQVEAIGRMHDYLARRPMPFRLWLYKTARERLLKAQRQHLQTGRRALGREVPLPDHSSLLLAQQLVDLRPSPSQHFNQHELARLVREALAALAHADRDVLLMRHFEGLSNHEIGFVLGIEPAAVSQRHGRALIRLRKLLLARGLGVAP